MKILLDMNLSPVWVDFLKNEGFEAVHWSTLGDPRALDSLIMQWAAEHGFVVLTHDLDFGVLLAATLAHAPSVVQVRVPDPVPDTVGRDVIRVLRLREDLLLSGALVTIDKAKNRVRVLPFEGRVVKPT
jgi:predicted nuclease of predicted toxin-antitoxin system